MTNTQHEYVLPLGEDLPGNTYIFTHLDGKTSVVVTAEDVFTDSIIRKFVDFLRACGHYESNIYATMAQVTDEYFEWEHGKAKGLPLPEEELDLDAVLG